MRLTYLPNDCHSRVVQHLADVGHGLQRLLLLLQRALEIDVGQLGVVAHRRQLLLQRVDVGFDLALRQRGVGLGALTKGRGSLLWIRWTRLMMCSLR